MPMTPLKTQTEDPRISRKHDTHDFSNKQPTKPVTYLLSRFREYQLGASN